MQQQHVDWVIEEEENSELNINSNCAYDLVTLLIFKRKTDFYE